MAKEGISGEENVLAHYRAICEIVDGDVSAEVISTDFEGMVREGEALAALDEKIVVKIPMVKDGRLSSGGDFPESRTFGGLAGGIAARGNRWFFG